jgi:hypothetical protein
MKRMDAHRLAELRSLAYHRAIAERIGRDPDVVDQAHERVHAWIVEGRAPYYAHLWDEVLSGPRERLLEVLEADTEESRALRQATPFAGVIGPRERWRIWKSVRERPHARRGDVASAPPVDTKPGRPH